MQMALKALFQMKNYLENQEFAISQLSQNIENITQNNTTMVDMIKNNQKETEDKEDNPSNFSTEKINNKKTNKKAQIITDKLENINHTAQNLHSIAKQLHENLKNMG